MFYDISLSLLEISFLLDLQVLNLFHFHFFIFYYNK